MVQELDRLVQAKLFGSRSEALRFGARLVVFFQKRLHADAEMMAFEDAVAGLVRGSDVP